MKLIIKAQLLFLFIILGVITNNINTKAYHDSDNYYSLESLIKDTVEEFSEIGVECNTQLQVIPGIKVYRGDKEVDTSSGWVTFKTAGKYTIVFSDGSKYTFMVENLNDDDSDVKEETTEVSNENEINNSDNNDNEDESEDIDEENDTDDVDEEDNTNNKSEKSEYVTTKDYLTVQTAYEDTNGKEVINIKKIPIIDKEKKKEKDVQYIQTAYEDENRKIIIYNVRKNISRITNINIKEKKNKLVISWDKAIDATKYSVKIANNKRFKNSTTYSTYTNKKTIKNIKKNSTYYIKVKSVDGSRNKKWSKVKKYKYKGK